MSEFFELLVSTIFQVTTDTSKIVHIVLLKFLDTVFEIFEIALQVRFNVIFLLKGQSKTPLSVNTAKNLIFTLSYHSSYRLYFSQI